MKNKYPMVTIIIPLYVIEDRFFEDFKKFQKLDYPRFEIIVVCDKKVVLPKLKKIPVRLLLTGLKQSGPAEKRDLALKKAKGEICAFIDDDAYPDPKWLKQAVKEFENKNVVAVGGSGLTPPEDSFLARAGGHVYESFFVSGGFRERFLILSKRKKVKDWPAYNFLVLTGVLKNVSGWGSNFYGGEDTFLCLKLLKKGDIIYSPNAYVYHHRRALFIPHLKQIYNVSIHRGFFAKAFPETSRLLIYFVPTLLDLYFIVLLILSIFSYSVMLFLIVQVMIALFVAFLSVVKRAKFAGGIFAAFGILLTHFVYGIGFVRGYLTKEMKR